MTTPATAITTRNPRLYYALHWAMGYGTKYADGGGDRVTVYGFDSAAARDAACADYRAPNHCPTACLEPALASDPSVARAVRGLTSDVREWDDV